MHGNYQETMYMSSEAICQLFLSKYMIKDGEGFWLGREDMWHKKKEKNDNRKTI
jgi:hypothetical protein